jgi:hypothetical protein
LGRVSRFRGVFDRKTANLKGVSVLICGVSARPVLAVCRYLILNAATAMCAAGLAHEVARLSMKLNSQQPVAAAAVSRVEAFKQAEAEAQVRRPVAMRQVLAYNIPNMPAHLMAVQLDEAERPKVYRQLAKRRLAARAAAAVAIAASDTVKPNKRLPKAIMALGGPVPFSPSVSAEAPRFIMAESARDVTNRSLGVLVASKN